MAARAAAGARSPRLLTGTGAFAGLLLVPRVDATVGPTPGSLPEWLALPMSVLLGLATVGAFAFLGLGLALALAAPLLDQLSRRVEARARGRVLGASRGLRFEIVESLRGALYFLAAAPGVFLLGFVPVVGPLLSLLWGSRAVAFQMTDPALARRGLRFADKRRWHREWRVETLGLRPRRDDRPDRAAREPADRSRARHRRHAARARPRGRSRPRRPGPRGQDAAGPGSERVGYARPLQADAARLALA